MRQVAKPPSFAQEVGRLSHQDVREIERAGIERGRAKQQRGPTVEGAVSDHRAELVHRRRGQRERISVDVRDEQARVGRVRRAGALDGLEQDHARVVVHAEPGRPEGGEPQQFDVQIPVARPPRLFRYLDHRPGGPRSSERAYVHDRVDRNVDLGDARPLDRPRIEPLCLPQQRRHHLDLTELEGQCGRRQQTREALLPSAQIGRRAEGL